MSHKKSFKVLLKLIAKYFYIIAFFMLVGGISAFYLTSNLPGYYESNCTILIDNISNDKEYQLNTFVTHLKTREVINEVADSSLDSKYSYEELSDMIDVLIIPDTDLIKITVKTSNPTESKIIVTNWIEIFKAKLNNFYPTEELKVIDYPVENTKMELINVEFYTFAGVGLGFILSVLLISLLGTIDMTVKNHEDAKKYIDLKSLGIIPLNSIDEEVQPTKRKKKKDNRANIKIITNPNSLISESYRMVRTNLDFLDLKVINFTSTAAGEGKSEAIANIAMSFSMTGKKVLIIDCDLRKPMIHKIFNLNRTLGISDIILYNRIDEYKKMIQTYKTTSNYQIDVLTAGSKIYNPSEMLDSARFKNFLNTAKEEYDLVLLDCPPVSLMTDAVIVSKIADGTAYIIEYNRINTGTIKSCIEQLKDVNACVLGTIITKVNLHKQKKLYGNKYEYYSNYI